MSPASAQDGAEAAPTYADLADLADASTLIIHAKIRKQATLKPERAAGLKPGFARLYVEANTLGLIGGDAPVGESLRYLVDVPLDGQGKVPRLKKREVLLFAQDVPGRPGELKLAGPGAQMMWSEELAAQVRPILTELARPDAPTAITGVRDAISVAGNLAGESESQIFLSTTSGEPASLTIVHRPGMAPQWGVSWSDIVDQSAAAPQPETLGWYRLACFLPRSLPAQANLSRDGESQRRAAADYQFVVAQLGACPRTRN
ncbi:MAG: hypothetical protein ACK5NN_08220 [Sphingomonadaceae bacterium]